MYSVELFAGTQSFSKVAKEFGYKTFTSEINPNQPSDLCKDILKVTRKDLPKKVDFLWASPPCTKFSVAGRSSNFTNFIPNSSEAALHYAFVLKTLELIEELLIDNPNMIWFIENPMGYLRKFPKMQELDLKHVWYCQYGDTRAKPTDLWTNLRSWIPKKCKNNNPNCNHARAPRHSRTGTQGMANAKERAVIPKGLFEDIFKHIEDLDK